MYWKCRYYVIGISEKVRNCWIFYRFERMFLIIWDRYDKIGICW